MTRGDKALIERMMQNIIKQTSYKFDRDTKTFRRLVYLAEHAKTKRKRRKNIARLWNEYEYLVPQKVTVHVFTFPPVKPEKINIVLTQEAQDNLYGQPHPVRHVYPDGEGGIIVHDIRP